MNSIFFKPGIILSFPNRSVPHCHSQTCLTPHRNCKMRKEPRILPPVIGYLRSVRAGLPSTAAHSKAAASGLHPRSQRQYGLNCSGVVFAQLPPDVRRVTQNSKIYKFPRISNVKPLHSAPRLPSIAYHATTAHFASCGRAPHHAAPFPLAAKASSPRLAFLRSVPSLMLRDSATAPVLTPK